MVARGKGSEIEIGEDYTKSPEILCPHCSDILHLMIDAFKPDLTRPVASNCPHCGGEIYAQLLVVTDITLQGVISSSNAIYNLFKEHKRKLV